MEGARLANPLPRRASSRSAVPNASTVTPGAPSTSRATIAVANTGHARQRSRRPSGSLHQRAHQQYAGGTPLTAAAAVADRVNRSTSESPLILELDQHNTSSVGLSPRAAPRKPRRRVASSTRTVSASFGGLDDGASLSQDQSSLDVDELSALQLPVPGDVSGHPTSRRGRVHRNGRPASNHLPQHRTPNGNRERLSASSAQNDASLTDSSASYSGLHGNTSIAVRSSSPSSEIDMENASSATAAHNDETEDTNFMYETDADASDGSSASTSTAWTLIDRMRIWRNDALTQHLYTTAIFWSNKVFSRTKNPNDGFWLAQCYFSAGFFSRAERVLTSVWEVQSHGTESTATQRLDKGKGRERDDADESSMFVDGNAEMEATSGQARGATSSLKRHTGLSASQTSTLQPPTTEGTVRATTIPGTRPPTPIKKTIRLADISVACRYLAAQAMVRQEKWSAAMDMLGEVNPFKHLRPGGQKLSSESGDGGIKFEASMCHLRGLVQLHLNATDRAKECFMEALSIDVKCYDSFEALIGGNMMEVDEEWHFIQGLMFKKHTPEDAEFIRMMYTVRLKKYAHRDEIATCSDTLITEYGLADDPDVLFGLADELYNAMRFSDCYALTTRILRSHDTHAATLPLHLACMQHLPHLRSKLFLLAHELVDREPETAVSWYAVGLWYFSNKKWEEARRYFGKALLIDSRLGCAWMGFAHSFALEGEHDQAITAYSTAQRHFQGMHLPLMFIGMQYTLLSNIKAADEYLNAAFAMCKTDPLLLNERGVAAYYNERYTEAIQLFQAALRRSQVIQSAPESWTSTHLNLAQAHRKIGQHELAIASFKKTLELDSRCASALVGMGVSQMMVGREEEAIDNFHAALSIQPGEPMATELLRIALQHAIHSHSGAGPSMSFPLLSDVAVEEMDAKVAEDEMQHYGRLLRDRHPDQPGDIGVARTSGLARPPTSTASTASLSMYPTYSASSNQAYARTRAGRQHLQVDGNSAMRDDEDDGFAVDGDADYGDGQDGYSTPDVGDGVDVSAATSMRRRTSSHQQHQRGHQPYHHHAPYHRASVRHDGQREENENDDSTEDSAMIEASLGSDMVD